MNEHGISKKVRLIMAAAAVGLLGIIVSLMLLQTSWQEKARETFQERRVPALGPVEARPNTPPFLVSTGSGTAITLQDFDSQVLYINYWAEWCKPCIEELPYLKELESRLAPAGVSVLLVNMDYGEENIQKAKELQRNLFPGANAIYSHGQQFKDLYLIDALPFHMLVDKQGRTASSFYASLLDNKTKFEQMIQTLLEE